MDCDGSHGEARGGILTVGASKPGGEEGSGVQSPSPGSHRVPESLGSSLKASPGLSCRRGTEAVFGQCVIEHLSHGFQSPAPGTKAAGQREEGSRQTGPGAGKDVFVWVSSLFCFDLVQLISFFETGFHSVV